MPIPSDIFQTMQPQKYEDLKGKIQNGDIVLFSGPELFSRLIRWITKSPWSHTGLILRLDNMDKIILLESVENAGIRAAVLSNKLNGYNRLQPLYKGKVLIARHSDFSQVNSNELKAMAEFAIDRLGAAYSILEVIKIAIRIMLGVLLKTKIAPFLRSEDEFICSEYVARCYQVINIEIQWDELGFIAPNDIASDPKINAIAVIQTVANN